MRVFHSSEKSAPKIYKKRSPGDALKCNRGALCEEVKTAQPLLTWQRERGLLLPQPPF